MQLLLYLGFILALYLGLTANLEWRNLLLGLVISAGVVLVMRPVGRSGLRIERLPAALWALIRYLGVLIADLIQSGLTVARIVLSPKLPIQPGIIAIPTSCESDLAVALSAHALTVTPGELVVEIGEDRTLYVHALDASHRQEYIVEAQQLRQELLRKIIE